MSVDPTQVLNNMKRSFNVRVENALEGADVNYDADPFETSGLQSWFSVRYAGFSSESVGMGDLIENEGDTRGMEHSLHCEISAWCRDDPQRAALGEMVDKVVALAESPTIPLYDFSDPENPVEIGVMRMKSGTGSFTPIWQSSDSVWRSSGELHAQERLAGYVLEIELRTIAEVG